MSQRNTTVRSLHDLGLAGWFGGSLMGAVGLNGAAAQAQDPRERLSLSAEGWKRWAPVNAAAIGAHAVGGAGLILANRRRVRQQDEAAANTAIKLALTVTAAGLTAYSGVLGAKVQKESDQGGKGATEPSDQASAGLAAAQRQLQAVQWAIPAITGVLVVMGAQQGEQQRPSQQLRTRLGR
ncbi:hypothetical protein ENKNEFLB_02232 [Nocardioides aquaticus]|jgi:hypothetical protein|uniref:DUF4235 domain-containing protein n=1 Tax=Nocardioides aquaticus TaxID=160826 RepID=A0ABX8EH46_9ACTN|nr:hypothetical protein [Nocardioides aquaticus]QVT79842.1 hypothetical protein ENKNEFLB_02232 [Nocardioides aquaticus]